MGRSVSFPSGAIVAFHSADIDDEFEWEYLVEDFREQVAEMFPSTFECDGYLGREDRVLCGNQHALFGMSEYGGLIAYWMVPRHDAGCSWVTHSNYELSDRWVAQVAPTFTKRFARLERIGTASNGESFYSRIAA